VRLVPTVQCRPTVAVQGVELNLVPFAREFGGHVAAFPADTGNPRHNYRRHHHHRAAVNATRSVVVARTMAAFAPPPPPPDIEAASRR